jgi:hypothetical protein
MLTFRRKYHRCRVHVRRIAPHAIKVRRSMARIYATY